LNLKRGYDLPNSERQDGIVPIVSSAGIFGHHNQAKVEGPGVVTGRYGTLGEVFYVEEDFWPLNTALYVQDFKGNDKRFTAYFLKQILKGTTSDKAAVPGVNRNDLHARKVYVTTDTDTQQRIADILSSYDDLIENNSRRIDLLEQSARLLYKEWFVSLRFPGHEHITVKDGVPQGWEKTTVGNMSDFLSRGITPTYDDEAPGLVINQKCIRDGLLNLQLARHQKKEVPKDKLVRFGDVLVNSTGEGTLGRIAQVITNLENCTTDSHVTIVRPSPKIGQYYFGMALLGMESYLSTMGRGATNQTELSRATIADIEMLLPSTSIALEFEGITKDLYSQISNLLNQNEKLQQARDLLLPRLMNGEIPV
jgi:type I restriction enzyme S subunit